MKLNATDVRKKSLKATKNFMKFKLTSQMGFATVVAIWGKWGISEKK